MPYSDLYSDAALFWSWNNTQAYVTTATVTQQAGDVDPLFVPDSPAGIGATHSAHINHSAVLTTASLKRTNFQSFPSSQANGRTYSTWMKIKTKVPLVNGSTNLGGNAIVLYVNDPSSGASDDDRLQINLGTYNQSEYGGSDRYLQSFTYETTVSTNLPSRSSSFSFAKVPLDKWFHVAQVIYHDTNADIIERTLYIDGVVASYFQTTNRNYNNIYWQTGSNSIQYVAANTYGLSTTNSPNIDVYQSFTGLWNRPLTINEIRQQAWVAHENENYNSVVLADNPVYYADFDNTVFSTPHSVYGTGNWEPWQTNSTKSFLYNQQAFANKRGWKNVINTNDASSNRIVQASSAPNFRTGLGQLIRTGEFSIEFWFKMNDRPVSTRTLFGTPPTTATLKDGYIEFAMNTNGTIRLDSSYKSGATSYLSGNLSTNTITIPTSTATTIFPFGSGTSVFCDGKWHHVVYTMTLNATPYSNSNTYLGAIYIDGMRFSTRNWNSTNGWLDGVDALTEVYLGWNTNVADNRDFEIAAMAFYPERLSATKIFNHFIAGADYVSDYGAVKYYDGTAWQTSSAAKVWNGSAWIDWSKKYYDGTQWVNL